MIASRKFLGIDLGWISGASGLCCLAWQNGELQLLDLDRQEPVTDILAWVDTWVPPGESEMIAVDAPTLIPNTVGMRLVDRLILAAIIRIVIPLISTVPLQPALLALALA